MTAGILPACQQTIAAFVFVILTLFLPPALQCVYMLCDKGTVLGDVHDAVKCMLERKEGVSLFLANATYMPHMSLVYGVLNREQKEEAKAMALEKLSCSFETLPIEHVDIIDVSFLKHVS